MHLKKYIQINAEGRCFSEFTYEGQREPVASGRLRDVTARADGPWLGKIYDAVSDTFSWPEPVASLAAWASPIERGATATLLWTTSHAVSAEIDQGVGALEPVGGGQIEVSPERTTTYQLTATGREGTTPATPSVTVTVTEPEG